MQSDVNPDGGKQSTAMESNESVARTQVPGTERTTTDPNERQNASQSVATASKPESKFHLYVHLASGEVKKMTHKAFREATDETGTQNAINVDGSQHQVIGVYPKELKLDDSPESDDDE